MNLRRWINFTSLSLAAIFTLMIAVKCYAELPPAYYLELQDKAPEYIKIEVVTAKPEKATATDSENGSIESLTNVELEAKVVEVVRSKSGLKPGDTIRIKYQHATHSAGWAGPSEIPILEKGQVRTAFLSKEKDHYEPAAKGRSFAEYFGKKAAK